MKLRRQRIHNFRSIIDALITLISALRELPDLLCGRARAAKPLRNSVVVDVPDMKEFFQFDRADRQYVMRNWRWP